MPTIWLSLILESNYLKNPLYTPHLNFGMHWMKQNTNKMKQHLKLQSKINCLMKKISSMNNSLYRLQLVSGNKLQKIFTICHNARILILYCRCGSLSPFPLPQPHPGGADITSPLKKILYLKHYKIARHIWGYGQDGPQVKTSIICIPTLVRPLLQHTPPHRYPIKFCIKYIMLAINLFLNYWYFVLSEKINTLLSTLGFKQEYVG